VTQKARLPTESEDEGGGFRVLRKERKNEIIT
jgi:hypothetical protein